MPQLTRHQLLEQRLDQFGPNSLRPAVARSAWLRFLMQFHNVLIYLLLFTASVTAALSHWVDTGVILGVVGSSALIGSKKKC